VCVCVFVRACRMQASVDGCFLKSNDLREEIRKRIAAQKAAEQQATQDTQTATA